jgi:ABC-type nitrate/sulfonate/bicarbonate transport system permease component
MDPEQLRIWVNACEGIAGSIANADLARAMQDLAREIERAREIEALATTDAQDSYDSTRRPEALIAFVAAALSGFVLGILVGWLAC